MGVLAWGLRGGSGDSRDLKECRHRPGGDNRQGHKDGSDDA